MYNVCMNTLRYKVEYHEQTVRLLKSTQNSVKLPSEDFFDIARMIDGEVDKEKLDKLFRRTYTVLALDNDNVVGVASIDKDGNVGIFAIPDGGGSARIGRLLSGALDRRAAKKELPLLFVMPIDGKEATFKGLGYEPFDNGSGGTDAVNESLLAKKIVRKERVDISPSDVKRFELDPTKKISVEGSFSVFPAFLFGIACFFLFLYIILSVTTYDPAQRSAFIAIGAVVGVIFVVASAVMIGYFVRAARLKKKVSDMNVTNGIITSLTEDAVRDTDSNSDDYGTVKYTYVNITYVYYDAEMQRHEARFRHKYNSSSPYFYIGQELVVAYSASESYILRSYTVLGGANIASDENTRGEVGLEKARSENITAGKRAQYVPIGAVKMYYAFAASLAVVILFLLAACLILPAFSASGTSLSYTNALSHVLPFMSIGIVAFGVPCVIYLIIPVRARSAYDKLLNSPTAKMTDGKLVHSEKTYKSDNKLAFYCEYSDGKEKKRLRVPAWIASTMVKHGNTAVKVVFDSAAAMVLVKKGKYPDIFIR